jgi:Protein of unknown function (DUF998)
MTTPRAGARLTTALLGAGVAAGPLYIVVGLAQALTRDGFDMRRHALSLLSNGGLGWIQIASFLVSGLLVIASAIGVRRALHGNSAGAWGPILLGIYGIGLIGAGLFVADPGQGFPPGTPMQSPGLSRDGMLHFVFGGIGFYSLIAACFVFGRRFLKLRQPAWAIYSMFSGTAFFFAFAAIASGSKATAIMLAFYAGVAWIWLWHTALSTRLLYELRHSHC